MIFASLKHGFSSAGRTALCCSLLCAPVGCTAEPTGETVTGVVRQVSVARQIEVPEGEALRSEGLDIDGLTSARGDQAGCRRVDFLGPDGQTGVDNEFSYLFDVIETLFEAGTVEALLQEAIREGRFLMMMQVEGIDDPQNDDNVTLRIFAGEGTPDSQGGVILGHQTFDRKPDSEVATVRGRIVDGVLTAGPVDVAFPIAILNVFFELELQGATVQGRLGEDGGRVTVGGGVPLEMIYEVGAMADAMQEDQISPALRSFLPIWADLNPDADGKCQSISANMVLEIVPAYTYPDTSLD